MKLLQQFSDKIYIRGLPFLLYKTRRFLSNGINIFTDPDGLNMQLDIDNYFQNNIRYGYYEYEVREQVKEILQPGDWMVDIGCNIGYISCVAASKVGPAGRILAFEPNEETIEKARKNADINDFENIIFHHCALSDKNGEAEFYVGVESALSTLVKNAGFMQVRNTIKVILKKFDDLMEDENYSREKIKLVKIDVEGHEYEVLRGMKEFIKLKKSSFLIENNPPAQIASGKNLQDILEEFFFNNHYKVYWLSSKENKAFIYKKGVIKTRITAENVSLFNNKSGDFLVSI